MAIDYDRLLSLRIPDREQRYTWRDSALYALGLGAGLDPASVEDLRFVYEQNMRALPTMAVVLAHPGFWIRDLETGIDWVRVVHGEQGLEIHRDLPMEGTVVGQNRVVEIVDKGEGRGALVVSERRLFDKAGGDLLATIRQVTFCRADGGFGGPAGSLPAPHAIPDRAPDLTRDIVSTPQSALVYRLSGDFNPLHADPSVARAAGFERPILHGLATYGIAGRAVLAALCDGDPHRLAALDGRFTAPVYPGETFRTEIWRDAASPALASFRVRCLERNVIAINNGRIALRSEQKEAP